MIKVNKNIFIQLVMIIIAFGFLYNKAISLLISDWSNNPNFSHGFLIPFVAFYMGWCKQHELANTPVKPSNLGLIAILFAMFVHILGHVGSELFLMRFSIIIAIAGIIIYFFGFKVFLKLIIPVAYLILMIPIPAILWNKIAFPLQLFAAKLSSHTINLIGIPVFREGNVLHLSNTSLEVVDACSGLRSLTSLIALTGAFAYISQLGKLNKWILFFSAIPIAVLVNVIRLTITGAMAAWISPETAHGFLHDMSGLIIFGTALFLVYSLYRLQIKIEFKIK